MKRIIAAVLAISLILLLGCAKEMSPTVPEKVAVKNNIVVGDKDSSILGYIIHHMDEYDREKLSYALENAQPDVPFEWKNDKAGTSYRYTVFSENSGKKKGCTMAEIYSGNKRLKACADISFDPERGWIIKSQQ